MLIPEMLNSLEPVSPRQAAREWLRARADPAGSLDPKEPEIPDALLDAVAQAIYRAIRQKKLTPRIGGRYFLPGDILDWSGPRSYRRRKSEASQKQRQK